MYNILSRILGSPGSPRGHFPIDLDEICQNIVSLDPADAFSGGSKSTVFSLWDVFPLPCGGAGVSRRLHK